MNEYTKFYYQTRYADVLFSFDSPYWLDEPTGLSGVEVNVTTQAYLNEVEAGVTSWAVQPRAVTLNGCIFDPLKETRANLIRAFAPGVSGRLTCMEPSFSRYVDVMPTKTPEISGGNGVQDFQCELIAPYPYWTDIQSQTVPMNAMQAMFRFPRNFTGVWRFSNLLEGEPIRIVNEGNVPAPFQLRVSVVQLVRNMTIRNYNTGQKIIYGGSLTSGETLVIDTKEREIYTYNEDFNMKSNRYFETMPGSILSMALDPGENVIGIEADGEIRAKIIVPKGVYSGV